jgi:hypothetical protein
MVRNIAVSAGKILLFFGLWGAGIAGALLAVLQFAGPHWFGSIWWRIAVEAGGATASLVALVLIARLIDRRGLDTIGLPPARAVRDLLAGTILGVTIFSIPLIILIMTGAAQFVPDYSRFSGATLGVGLLLVFVNVLDQEFLVRSYLFQEIWRSYSAMAAIVVSTIVFVAVHANPISKGLNGEIVGVNIMLASIVLGIAYLRSRALWLPIGIHFGWNGVQGPVLGINVTGADPGAGPWHAFAFHGAALWTGGSMGIEGGLAGLAGPLVGIVLVWLLYRRKVQACQVF